MPLFTLHITTQADTNTPLLERVITLRLTDEAGQHLGAQQVRLSEHPVSLWEGLFDTRRHVERYEGSLMLDSGSEPATAAQLLARLGVFLGRQVLGEPIMHALAGTQHRTVLVQVPGAQQEALAASMARVPWEIARLAPDAPPLMQQNLVVRMVAEMPAAGSGSADGRPVRVLLVFAEAPGSRPLAMRLEREHLLRLFLDDILPQRQVEVDVLCHGVTRQRWSSRCAAAAVITWCTGADTGTTTAWNCGPKTAARSC
jgi:hypothetical protein